MQASNIRIRRKRRKLLHLPPRLRASRRLLNGTEDDARLAGLSDLPEDLGLGDLPDDISEERLSRPPILNAKEFSADEQIAQEIERRLPRWHQQSLNNFMVQIGIASTLVLPFNPRRAYLILINDGTNVIRIAFGHSADLISGIPLAVGGGFFEPILGSISEVHAISTVAAQNLLVIEGQYVQTYE